ncbi:MAG: ABC transporter substrate-binding protein, partial [Bauldia sp.]
SIADSLAEIRAVADLTGHPQRGEAIAASILSAEERARLAAARPQGMPSAVFYQRRGYTTGSDTLTAELMTLVGLTNAGGVLAGAGGAFVPLERLVAARPDYLVVETATARADDQGSALLAHPALARLYPTDRRIVLPARLTVCGGVSLAAAIDWLSREAERVTGGRAP